MVSFGYFHSFAEIVNVLLSGLLLELYRPNASPSSVLDLFTSVGARLHRVICMAGSFMNSLASCRELQESIMDESDLK